MSDAGDVAMWHGFVSLCDAVVQRFVLGFVNTCSAHPLLSACFLALMAVLAGGIWLDQILAPSGGRRRVPPPQPDRPRRTPSRAGPG